MIFDFSGTSSEEEAVLRRAFGRFPEVYTVRVTRTHPTSYVCWIQHGMFGYLITLTTDGGPLDKYVDELTDQGYRGMAAIGERVAPPKELTFEEQIKLRMEDFRRTMSGIEIEERLEKGQLQGLEFMKGTTT